MKRALVVAFLAITSQADAQGAPPQALGTLEGVVVDSVRGGPLRGAAVKVEGTSRFAFTDTLGRYRVDSVPAGSFAVELFHEILDTLGVRVYAPPVEFVPGVTVTLDLGIPSPRTIIRSKCQSSAADAGAVFGVVLDADREEPLAGVEVSVAWTELRISREGFGSDPHRRTATTDSEGRFKLCYLPVDLSADILAARGSDSTSAVHVMYEQAAFGTATIFLDARTASVAAETPATPRRGASLRGLVVDSAGKPVSGARVGFASSPNAAVTDSGGVFSIEGLRPGTQAVIVRRLGYAPAEVVVNLTRRQPREVRVELAPFVPVLEAVLVQARRDVALERVGFTSRRRMGSGRFLSQEQLERRNAFRIEDFLALLPSLYRGTSSMSGDNCVVFWVDGMKWHSHPDEFMVPAEVGALEAYSASMAPVEFQGLDGCAVVLIWTKLKLGIR